LEEFVATRQLGQTGLKIDPFILGGNVFGWTIGQDMSFRILDAFLEAGFRWIDTANLHPETKAASRNKFWDSG
jgi:aryl-alcohol dehydrogenase-like predicted oxidoreductase